ncbi:hypothetical protein ABBQ38_002068 [Trebouxia sp. C0009 RCD-2024]
MRPTSCLRPAACVQPRARYSLLASSAGKAPRVALASRPSLTGQFSGLPLPLPGSLTRRAVLTGISASSDFKVRAALRQPKLQAGPQLSPVVNEGLHIPWRSMFRVRASC